MAKKPTYEDLERRIRDLETEAIKLQQAEKALHEAEERYRSLFERSIDCVWVNDLEGNFVDANPAALNLIGYEREEVPSLSYSSILNPSDHARALKTIADIIAAGSQEELQEYELILKNGSTVTVEALGSLIYRDGKPFAIIGIARDITERKRAESVLRESQERYRDLVETVIDWIWEVDTRGKYTYVSPRAHDILGYEPEELLGKTPFDLMPSQESARMTKIFNRTLEAQATLAPIENVHIHKDGHLVFLETSGKPFYSTDGKLLGYRGIDRDISEKKILQAEAMRVGHLASLGELAAGVAHEINNPINGVINYAEILKDECKERGEDEDIPNRIIKEGERIAEIVRNLLSFAQDQKEEYRPVHVKEILSDSLSLVGKQIEKDGIVLKMEDFSALPAVKARPQMIKQVFINILSNARYALNQRFPEFNKDKILEILGETLEIEGRTFIRTTFHDFGSGIPLEIQDKICDPFFSTKPKNEGTGLGLSISHGIIRNHKGRLSFESEEGAYAKVKVDLPVWKSDGES